MADAPVNTVEKIARELARQILRGELPPHSHLPSVRALADRYDVNISTVHRVLARLEASGWVRAEERRGVVVLDPHAHGSTGHWPARLQDAAFDLDASLALLDDALEIRRVLALHVVRGLAQKPVERYAPEVEKRLEAFRAVVDERPADLEGLLLSEHEMTRVLLQAANKPAALAVFNDVERMMLASKPLLAAMYDQPERTVAAWELILGLLRAQPEGRIDPGALENLEALMKAIDEACRQRFAALVQAEHAQRRDEA